MKVSSLKINIALCALLLVTAVTAQAQTATSAPITGEIERLTLTNPNDVWSGGTIVVGGQNIIIPRNLLMDLPANRLTLQQTFAQAPQECLSRAERVLRRLISATQVKWAASPRFTPIAPATEMSLPAISFFKKVLSR